MLHTGQHVLSTLNGCYYYYYVDEYFSWGLQSLVLDQNK